MEVFLNLFALILVFIIILGSFSFVLPAFIIKKIIKNKDVDKTLYVVINMMIGIILYDLVLLFFSREPSLIFITLPAINILVYVYPVIKIIKG